MEKWASVPNFHGCYEVSTLGRVRSLDRRNSRGYRIKGKMLKPYPNEDGYLRVDLRNGSDRFSPGIHSLMGEVFLGPRMGMDVDHIDHDRSNNKLSNLRYLTHRENSSRGKVSKLKHDKSSTRTGVTRLKKGRKIWLSRIYINGKNVNIGYFLTEKEAGDAYQERLNQLKNEAIQQV